MASTAALAAEIVLRPWTVVVKADPATTQRARHRLGIPGAFTVAVVLLGPDEVAVLAVNCVIVAGVTLPPLKPLGRPLSGRSRRRYRSSPGAGITGVLDGSMHSSSFAYTTVVESMADARGDTLTGLVQSDVSITRKEISDTQKAISDLIFKQIPNTAQPLPGADSGSDGDTGRS